MALNQLMELMTRACGIATRSLGAAWGLNELED